MRPAAPADPRPGVALVAIDLQNDFVHPEGLFASNGMTVPDLDGLFGATNRLVAAARRGGRPVYWVRMVWDDERDGGLLVARSPMPAIARAHRRGTWGAELHEALDSAPGDRMIDKTRFSAFFRTDLERHLADDGIGTLVVAGVRTDFCVESTVRDAFFRDLRVLVAAPAVSGYVPELHENSLLQMGTVFAEVAALDRAERLLTGESQA
ncbi:cysteine hydrolase family protein [Actinomadura madurae]|uniref:cysteine hydrolase family protein n=1 Tax=Actinomadura madurae TaxID=1993 RepID=UPI002027496A|nr:isochorismatase family cysteine hydrolase [Actinomadura madurae]MCQ0007817.1 cysteine hydrolase [Actinomadura madurae]MCQ0016869.1 cysteine hydrolase [Actinomadura madurae]URM96930.1 cysteine hydrolase [Actinomadura madurae]